MYQLSEEVLNQVLQYLSSRPFCEVWQLINAVNLATKSEEPKKRSKVVVDGEVV